MRKIIIMSEYNCYPLWEAKEDGLINFEAYELGISYELAKKIEDWGEQFELTYNADDPVSSSFKSEDEKKNFIATGNLILKELRSALSRNFEIEYRMLNGERQRV